MVEAAQRLFLEQGYGPTSIDEIAEAAGVSTPTVYAKFGSKAGLLKVVVDVAVAGDDDDVTVADRPEFQSLASDAPLAERIRWAAHYASVIHRRSAPVIDLVASVAGADPAVAELHASLERQLRETAALLALTLPAGAVRAGLDETEVVDLIYAYSHPRTWTTLVDGCGWTDERYATWLEDVLTKTVFDLEGAA